MASYNWDKTRPLGTQSGADLDNAIRETREGVEAFLGTEHVVDLSNPTAVKAKHALNSARAGYGLEINKPTTGQGVETGRIYICSDTKKLMFGNGASLENITVDNADTVDGAHAGTAANNVLKLDANGLVPIPNVPTLYYLAPGWGNPRTLISYTDLITLNANAWATVRTVTLTVTAPTDKYKRVRFNVKCQYDADTSLRAMARIKVNGAAIPVTPETDDAVHEQLATIISSYASMNSYITAYADLSPYLVSGTNTVTLEIYDPPSANAYNNLFQIQAPELLPFLNSSGNEI